MRQQDIRLPGKGPPERDSEPTTAPSIGGRASRKESVAQALSRHMAHWRELEPALRASNPVPKPSWISGFAALIAKSIPPRVVSEAITDFAKGWLEARRAANEPDQPTLPFLPDQ